MEQGLARALGSVHESLQRRLLRVGTMAAASMQDCDTVLLEDLQKLPECWSLLKSEK